ncbi:hypothetical protein R8Z50_21990 [Longispora sp. K20-0274]|uniref:hypothetical protein n=1 Tax=Longispora sp. K20-0274 TaxID=3088255 RepID=UPI00399A0575
MLDLDRIAAIVAVHAPASPRDGDCVAVSEQVTAALTAHGFDASTVMLTGWVGRSVIGLMHQVTAVAIGGEVVLADVTARQFLADLPSVWVAPQEDYLTEFTTRLRLERTTVAPIPVQAK